MFVEYNFSFCQHKIYIYQGDETRPFAALNVKNARMRKVNLTDVASYGKKRKLYGFEVRSRDQSHYFFADSKMRQNKWIRKLRSTCILLDVCRTFFIGSMIG